MTARWIAACAQQRLDERRMLCVSVAGLDLLLLRDGELIVACERACPHEQADLAQGRVADGRLHCPRHQAWFSLSDGAISPGWSSRPLRRYPVQLSGGTVYIDVATPSS